MKRLFRILVLEDEPLDFDLIKRSLERAELKFSATRVETREEFVHQLQTARPDVILSDHGIPEFSGMDALKLVKRGAVDVPFIFVAGALGEEMVIEAFERGAQDYVLKHHLPELVPAIERALEKQECALQKPPPAAPQLSFLELFQSAVEQAREAVVVTTAQLELPGPQFIYTNRAFTLMTGYTADEVVGKTPRMLQGPKTDRKVLNQLKEQLARGESFEGETVNYRKDGSEFILQWEIAPIRDETGEITYFVSLQRDVTARRRLEAERIEHELERVKLKSANKSARQIAELLERMTDAFVFLDRSWCYQFVNRKAAEIFGRKPEDLIGKNIWTEFPEGVGQPFQKAYEMAAAEQRALQVEYFYKPLNKWFENRIYPSPTGLAIFFQDTTERKRAEEALRSSEEFSRRIIESSSDCIKVLDLDGRLLSMTEAGQQLMEITELKPYLGKLWVDFWKNDHHEEAKRALADARAGGTGRFQGFCPTMMGTSKYWDVICTPILDLNGNAETILSVARDITILKRAEEQRRIVEASQEANRELEAFSYSVSHDLKAPIRHINAFVEILQETAAPKLDAEENKHLQTIATAVKKTDKLIDDLLSFSRVTRAEFGKTDVSMKELVDESIETFAIEIKNRQVQWIRGNLPVVRGDPNMLLQVIANLLSNALKYTRPRAIARIEISSYSSEQEHVIFVRDNGVGFDLQSADNLFGVFQRFHRETEFEGTGIGLASVRRIVERHGGKVWADSRLGEGATFYFSLPRQ